MTKAINRQPSRLSFWGLLVDEVKGREETQGLSCQGIKEVRRETRLTTAGHVLLAGAVLALACAVVVVGRREAQSRQSLLGYCNRAPIQLLESFSPSGTIAPSPLPLGYAGDDAGWHYRSRYHERARVPDGDVAACFGGAISVSRGKVV